ncbi:uncharacterized protein PGTG_18453 [Puccinia graminis f. sp. tritici CRL 75-36-700-3]|uniref:Uncharacterized protein n=1 Tax=Puccinia graminis f. sp. tritici (strain CRL 75-36-700-3 / race SCCL) TaxID=418459 RepID=E3L6R3_PUCGT|nr:uncharacterized protein PGTG_18453 [Puccinia graminis f. sp. tritici CRL 75-36-700-3]EFP92238.2 hypothetical protein PGTG_18453 [Puccinia graminis f. sp. tritici CRL 75-36-700-3]
MTHQSPIYVSSNGSSGVGPMADELEISMLLTPHGHTFYSDDVFSQDEFDSLEAVVLNRFVHYCKSNQPKDYNDHDARVHTYIQIREAFYQANNHKLEKSVPNGMPHSHHFNTPTNGVPSSSSNA